MTMLILTLIFCTVLAVGAMAFLFWLATKNGPGGDPNEDPKTTAQRLVKAQRDFGNDWGAHG